MVFSDAHHAQTAVSSGSVPSHALLRGYLLSSFFACGMSYWCWVGVHWNGSKLRDLTGGRWTSWQKVVTDFAIALPFWVLGELTARLIHHLLNRVATPTTPYQPPLQGLLFGLIHTYQGWKQVMIIAPLGILYGALVAWRRNLRASMIAHAWSDIFEGWLRFL
jgi:Type II CAAX prenyl endopeptidase Rce1-like